MATDYLTALGAGSGLDTRSIVDSLVEAQRAPAQAAIDRNIAKTESRVSAYGVVKSSLAALKGAFDQLKDVSDLNEFQTTVSSGADFTAVATSAASAGNHSITIQSMASRDIWSSNGFASATSALNSDTPFSLDVTIDGTTTTVNVTTATPQGVVDAMNAADLGIDANLVNTGTGANPYTISLSGQEGAQNAFTVKSTSADVSFLTQRSTASDASLTVNGIAISRSTNSISDVIDGVTLNLQSESGVASSMSLSNDTSQAKSAIQNLVSTYNDVYEVFKSLRSNEDSEDKLVGALSSDGPFRGIMSQIRAMVTGVSSTPSGEVDSFSSIGVSITREGYLEINEGRLDSQLSGAFDDVVTALTGDLEGQSDFGQLDGGLAGDASKELAAMLRSTGVISQIEISGEKQIDEYESRLDDLDARMSLLFDRYTQQFAAMQSIVDQMNNTRSYLEQQLSNLPFSQKD